MKNEICALILFWLVPPTLAHAELGGDPASVQADQARMKGSLRVTPNANYEVQEISTPNGTLVKEYLAPTGEVFAVSWRGPRMPDLRQMLGTYFQAYIDAANTTAHDHAHLNVEQADLVVQSTGHMHSFFGKAYVPALVPPGVPLGEIK